MTTKTFGFTGNQLKIFALICMTLDHAGILLFPDCEALRYIGRLSMPIFAWMIAEGCRYTKSKLRYLLTMASVALICQAVYWVVDHSLFQCILVTFSLSIVLIYSLDLASRKKGFWPYGLLAAVFAAIVYVCVFLPEKLSTFNVDYGIFGVMIPAAVYMGRTKAEKLFGAAVCLVGISLDSGLFQWFSLATLPILYFYNGKRGKARLKYLFYIYYPLHLAVLYGIAYLLSKKN